MGHPACRAVGVDHFQYPISVAVLPAPLGLMLNALGEELAVHRRCWSVLASGQSLRHLTDLWCSWFSVTVPGYCGGLRARRLRLAGCRSGPDQSDRRLHGLVDLVAAGIWMPVVDERFFGREAVPGMNR